LPKIVGYEVLEEENGEQSAELLNDVILREQCYRYPLVLHADNGVRMKSQMLKAKLEEMKITGLHSRPWISNGDPYVESLFRTLKHVPTWPSSGFMDLDDAGIEAGASASGITNSIGIAPSVVSHRNSERRPLS
jgi:putative transposase